MLSIAPIKIPNSAIRVVRIKPKNGLNKKTLKPNYKYCYFILSCHFCERSQEGNNVIFSDALQKTRSTY